MVKQHPHHVGSPIGSEVKLETPVVIPWDNEPLTAEDGEITTACLCNTTVSQDFMATSLADGREFCFAAFLLHNLRV